LLYVWDKWCNVRSVMNGDQIHIEIYKKPVFSLCSIKQPHEDRRGSSGINPCIFKLGSYYIKAISYTFRRFNLVYDKVGISEGKLNLKNRTKPSTLVPF
jgi:hypothetical protein